MSEPSSSNQRLQIGEELGPFKVVEQIGLGGSAVVYKAHDAVVNRYVAIKQLLPDHDDEVFRQRFRQEAELQRRISEKHQSIVKLYDVRDDERGIFLIMEYVEGRSLESVLAQTGEPIDPTMALRIVYAIADVLETIHAQGVIHRDLKPANILLPSNAGTTVKICDLGLATVMAEQEALSLGSVRYMAPELFNAGSSATGQADLYALGMIAYEMLIGRQAFDQTFKTILRDQRSQAMRWMKWHTNTRLKVTAINLINDRIPVTVSELIGRLLEKETVKRVDSAAQLKESIQRHFGRRTKQAPPQQGQPAPDLMATSTSSTQVYTSPGETAKLPRKFNWLLVGAIVGMVFVLGAGVYYISESMEVQQKQAERRDDGLKLFVEADEAYAEGELTTARNRYSYILEGWKDDPGFVERAQAGLLLVNTKQHLADGNLDAAAELLAEIDDSNKHDQLTIRTLRREIELRQNFREQVAALERALDQGRLGAARVIIDEYMDAELSGEEMTQLQTFATRLRMARLQQQVDAELKEAEKQLSIGDVRGAMDTLQAVAKRSTDPRIAEQLDALQTKQEYDALITSAEQAQSSGRLADAIATYRKALKIRHDDELEATIQQLHLADVLARAKQHLDNGEISSARFLYLEATDIQPDHPEATRQLAAMAATDNRRARIQAGDASFHREDFNAAVNHYLAAEMIRSDDELSAKLRRARLRLALIQAREHEAAGRHAQASTAYEQALAHDPNHIESLEALDRLGLQLRYEQKVAEGDEYRSKYQYAKAVTAYREARELIATDAIQQRLDDLEFAQLVAQTRSLMAARQYDAAESMLKTASGKRNADPAVIRKLLDELSTQRKQAAP